MSRTTITETCGCGATFTTSGEWASEVRKAAEAWREGHKHAESVGICGEWSPWLSDGGIRPLCSLKADHAGSHGSDDGTHWANIPMSVERPRPRPRIPLARRRA